MDVGCGNGQATLVFAARNEFAAVHGSDVSAAQIAEAKALVEGSSELKHVDFK